MTRYRAYAAWAGTRALLLVMLFLPRVGGHTILTDVRLYRMWGSGIAHWTTVPYRDFAWEYPPGAAAVITPPAVFGDYYTAVFVLVMVVADLLMLRLLLRMGERLGSPNGALVWLAGTTLMGPIVFTRFDTISALLAVLALYAMAAGMPNLAGVALGGGVVTKLWPAVLAVALPFVVRSRRVAVAAGVVVAATVLLVLSIGGAEHGRETFERHTRRGLQVESIVATPLVVAQRAGAAVDISFYRASGSWDVTGTGASGALSASSLLTLLALALIGWLAWRMRHAPDGWLDLCATALLLLAVTGKVLSPQYVVWLLAVLAAALCRRDSPLAVPAALVAGSAVLGQVVFPAYYADLVNGGGSVVVVALVVRNVLLVVATALAVIAVWRRTSTP